MITRRGLLVGGATLAAYSALPKLAEWEARAQSPLGISSRDFNIPDDGSADAAPGWQAMFAAAKEHGLPMFVPKGRFRFDSRIGDIDYAVQVRGLAASNTGAMLIKNYDETVSTRGCFEFRPGSDGSKFGGFYFKNERPGGTLISAKAQWNDTMTNLVMEDLNLSLADGMLPHYYIYYDGVGKYTAPQGNRVNTFRNLVVFGAQYASVLLAGCNGVWWHGGGIYPAGSTTQYAGTVAISGNSNVRSNGILIDIQFCGGLVFSQTNVALVRSLGVGVMSTGNSIEADSSVHGVKVVGYLSGAQAWNGATSSWHENP